MLQFRIGDEPSLEECVAKANLSGPGAVLGLGHRIHSTKKKPVNRSQKKCCLTAADISLSRLAVKQPQLKVFFRSESTLACVALKAKECAQVLSRIISPLFARLLQSVPPLADLQHKRVVLRSYASFCYYGNGIKKLGC